MKLASFLLDGQRRCGALSEHGLHVFDTPGDLGLLLRQGLDVAGFQALAAASTRTVQPQAVQFLPPLVEPPKILCIGLNYAEHTAESRFQQPDYPTVFLRVATATTGDGADITLPAASVQLDYEAEMVVVLGQGGRHLDKTQALECVFGYAVGNEVSVRDYQFKSPQWTMGKNFDGTGAWGPYLVTADTLPPGGSGLDITARLNGQTVQSSNTQHMIFDVATLISTLSEVMTLQAGDVIFTGTPAGVGMGRTPPLWMRAGDVVEVEIAQLGLLRNRIAAPTK